MAVVMDIQGKNGPTQVWDAYTYEGELKNPQETLPWWQGEGSHIGHKSSDNSLQRCPNGEDSNDNDSDFAEYPPTPGQKNMCMGGGQVFKVTTEGMTFAPDFLNINAGDTVQFSVGMSHNVLEVLEEDWAAGKAVPKKEGFYVDYGATKEIVFSKPGMYYYVCEPHAGGGMKGMIMVE